MLGLILNIQAPELWKEVAPPSQPWSSDVVAVGKLTPSCTQQTADKPVADCDVEGGRFVSLQVLWVLPGISSPETLVTFLVEKWSLEL